MNNLKHARMHLRVAVRFICAACTCISMYGQAGELTVNVTRLLAPYGSVGCSLFASDAGFPMDNSRAQVQWLPVTGESVTCRFIDLGPGRYAVSAAHDINGNHKLDTNLLGIPTEQWGVSNNARPSFRAPRFEEAAFNFTADTANITLDIKVVK